MLLNGWILPIGEVASGRVCACNLLSRLTLIHNERSQMVVLELAKGFKVPLVCLSSWNSLHPMHWPERAPFK